MSLSCFAAAAMHSMGTCKTKECAKIASWVSAHTHILSVELINHEGAPSIAQKIQVCHPDPVLRDLGPCDQEAREEEQGGDVSWQGGVCCVHVGRDGCYQVC